MKKTDLQKVIANMIGNSLPFVQVECRGCQGEVISYINKQGQKASFARMVVLAEANGDSSKQLKIELEKLPLGTVIAGEKGQEKLYKEGTQEVVPWPMKKGQQLLIVVSGMLNDRGNLTVKGQSWEIVED